MDQVKHYLRLAGKHHFWILCGVIAVLTLGSWYTSAAKLRTEFEAQKSKINTAKNKANQIATTPDHPNETYRRSMDAMINEYKDNLRELWQKQYNEQGVNLQWPIETETYRGLTPEFVEQVKDLRPIETTVEYDPTGKAPDKLRDNFKVQYINFIKSTELPRLATIIGAVWQPDQAGGATGPGGSGGPVIDRAAAEKAIVHWHGDNQAFLQDTRFDWSTTPTKRPSTLQILYAQEDLWVLETLINIIAKTNADADARHNAVVKEIKYLKLGVDAVGRSGEVMRFESGVDGPGGPEGQPQSPYGTLPGAPPGTNPEMGRPGVPGAAIIVDPAEGRYVDEKYDAVPPGRLREAFNSENPDEAFLAVAKRMPVRMHLVVDQRYINRLLAECGNSNLIVEIRQVRVNRPPFEGGTTLPRAGGSGYGREGGGERPRSGGLSGGLTGGARGGGPGSGPDGDDDKSHHEVDIELYGIVYIYNPVNEKMVSAVATAGSNPNVFPPAPDVAPPPDAAPPTVPPPVAPVDPVPVEPAPEPPVVPPVEEEAPIDPAAPPPAPAGG